MIVMIVMIVTMMMTMMTTMMRIGKRTTVRWRDGRDASARRRWVGGSKVGHGDAVGDL